MIRISKAGGLSNLIHFKEPGAIITFWPGSLKMKNSRRSGSVFSETFDSQFKQ
jgi:hypothetical protein